MAQRFKDALSEDWLGSQTTSGCSQGPVTPTPEDPMPSSGFLEYMHTHKHTNK